ncbi:histidine kinase [Photobacterium angustum]|uniref:histidine kinase n=1 Tax=Photobacterium angustum TaxID=661 RepID=A0ABX5GZ60_PHOAN|nr:ATP-binding protein [Photobacterium angustum]KJG39135.1 histidine kinase [Photobacterium angustum]PSX04948.1 HAMP domain-containing protein [Photobacterium angustum]
MIRYINKKTIGSRLIMAIILMAFLTITVSLIAVINWEKLSAQIETITDNNMPTLQASYQLERNTAELQAALNTLGQNTNPLKHETIKNKITHILDNISLAINNIANLHYYPAIKSGQQTLVKQIDNYTILLQQRNSGLFALKQTENSLKWIHHDLIDELTPLRQEVEWKLNNMNRHGIKKDAVQLDVVNNVMNEFSLIQSITIKENELHQLVEEIVLQRKNRDIENAFNFIGHKITELNAISKNISNYPSAVPFRQLLERFTTILKPGGQLEQQLKLDVVLGLQIDRTKLDIKQRLYQQEEMIQTLVEHADNSLKNLNDETHTAIFLSNTMLFGVVFITIILTIFLSVYLVGNGIVNRLNLLSRDLYAVAKGNLNAKIATTGEDEIGMLGDNLRDFCQQMQDIQTTNALNLINNTQASIITCNMLGVVESVNLQALKQFNFDRISQHQKLWDLFDSSISHQLIQLFHQKSPLRQLGAYKLTVTFSTDQNSIFYLRLDFRVFKQGNQDKVIITMTDITEQEKTTRWLESKVTEKTQSLILRNQQLKAEIEDRKRIEGDLIATQDELIQAAKMVTVGQTMTSLAHELNQPLSAISTRLFSAKLAIDNQKYDKLPDNIEKIEDLVTRMSKLITSLRNFAKKQSATNPLTRVDIQDSIKQAIVIVESRAKVQKTTITNTITTPLFAQADQVQLEQVLVNLLVNSCDAVASCEERQITILQLESTKKTIRIAVLDSGNGFSHDIIEKLFIPFTTTKDVGLGLGLSICGSIMTRLKGNIFLASGLTGGAMIVLELKKDDE